jgi:hypothetical protein
MPKQDYCDACDPAMDSVYVTLEEVDEGRMKEVDMDQAN